MGRWFRGWVAALLMGCLVLPAAGEELLEAGVNPGYHPQPHWFKQSFLDIGEDVAEAAGEGRRLLLYFYQDGCPYCAKLLQDNFGQRAIAEKTQRHFDVLALNIWGDREVTGLDGTVTTEKAFAASLGVMFTPTLLFLDEQGETVLRVNGYYHPHKFSAALDYASGERQVSFREFLAGGRPWAPQGELNPQPFFQSPPHALARNAAQADRPLVVLFEQRQCGECDEFHRDVLARPATRALMERFEVVQLDRWADTPVLTPDGRRRSARQWADQLGVQYTPTLVFFDRGGEEVFRTEAYLRAFHTQTALEYVASGSYREQPNFQRFVQARAERLEAAGEHIDLME